MPSLIKTTALVLPFLVSHVSAWKMSFNSEKNCAQDDPTSVSVSGSPNANYPTEDDSPWDDPMLIENSIWYTVTAEDWDDDCVLEFWNDDEFLSSETPTLTLEKDSRYVHDMGDGRKCAAQFPGADPTSLDFLSHWKYTCR